MLAGSADVAAIFVEVIFVLVAFPDHLILLNHVTQRQFFLFWNDPRKQFLIRDLSQTRYLTPNKLKKEYFTSVHTG